MGPLALRYGLPSLGDGLGLGLGLGLEPPDGRLDLSCVSFGKPSLTELTLPLLVPFAELVEPWREPDGLLEPLRDGAPVLSSATPFPGLACREARLVCLSEVVDDLRDAAGLFDRVLGCSTAESAFFALAGLALRPFRTALRPFAGLGDLAF